MHQINLCTNVFPPKSTYSRCVKCQIFGTFGTPNTKKPPIRCCICAKIISFMSVPLQICNDTDTNAKPKYCFLFSFLSPLTSGLGFFSLFSHQTQLLPQQRKNKMTHSTSSNNKLQGKVAIITGGVSGMGEATPIITIVIAAPISPISLSFLVVGCFDCWWSVDFG